MKFGNICCCFLREHAIQNVSELHVFCKLFKEVTLKPYKLSPYLDRTGIELSIGVNNKATEEYTNKRYLLTHYVINNRSFVKWLRKWQTAHLRICISKTLFQVVDIIALL